MIQIIHEMSWQHRKGLSTIKILNKAQKILPIKLYEVAIVIAVIC